MKAHARVLPGKRSTDPSDYPTDKASYAFRSIDGVRRSAEAKGEHVGLFAQRRADEAGLAPE